MGNYISTDDFNDQGDKKIEVLLKKDAKTLIAILIKRSELSKSFESSAKYTIVGSNQGKFIVKENKNA